MNLGNSGAVAGAVIGTLLGLTVLAGVIVGVIVIILLKLRKKDNNYTPPTRPNYVKTTTPSVKVVGGPGRHSAGHHVPTSSFTPSAPSHDTVVGNKKSSTPSRPPPPKPVSRPPPPTKPQSHAPPKPPPPVNHPAVKPHSGALTSASKPPPQGESKNDKHWTQWYHWHAAARETDCRNLILRGPVDCVCTAQTGAGWANIQGIKNIIITTCTKHEVYIKRHLVLCIR